MSSVVLCQLWVHAMLWGQQANNWNTAAQMSIRGAGLFINAYAYHWVQRRRLYGVRVMSVMCRCVYRMGAVNDDDDGVRDVDDMYGTMLVSGYEDCTMMTTMMMVHVDVSMSGL